MNQLEQSIRYLQEITRSNTENIQMLAAVVQTNEQRFTQLADSQAQLINSQERLVESQREVMSRMDDVVAIVKERL